MPWTREELRVFLSEDLLKENLDSVVQEIQEMQAGRGMVAANHEEPLLQGDVFENVPCVSRASGVAAISPRRAIVVSNSCDVSTDNPRNLPVHISVAPVLRLARYEQMLLDHAVVPQRVAGIVASIRRQEKSDVLFLPAGAGLTEDMVALLDQVQSMPFSQFAAAPAGPRAGVLTQRGFWVLLVKLSMHFLRPHEGVERAA